MVSPNKSAGTSFIPTPGSARELKTKLADKSGKDSFSITYFPPGSNTSSTFYFALLPAVEAQLQYGPSGALKGNASVPEVKPGIMSNTTMKYKNFVVPGGAPVVQAIGIQQTTHQLVGAFIGTDGKGASPELDPIYRRDNTLNPPLPWSNSRNAATAAGYFDAQVVQSARPVTVKIQSDVIYRYEGVIINFKFYAVRAERAYYIIDLLATRYPGLMSSHD